jgi:NADPH:quinone reductase-like Zn-dependent oxidoreductase
MKAFAINRYGKKVAWLITEIPEPKLVNIEVLVRVHAVDENRQACATAPFALCESTTI